MKKKIVVIGLVASLALEMVRCSSLDRLKTDVKSDINGGLQRTIKVYAANGDLLAKYEGK